MSPRHIVYVSCDPPTLARDLAAMQKGGYTVQTIHPLDMFPQTCHLESVVMLQARAA
jgi:23S rRNA (uracil1939-C5)-methyltransferase